MIIQYNIVVTIVNLIDNSTSRFNKIFETEVTAATDALLYNNYHILSQGVYVLDMFEDEVDAYCTALGIERTSVEVDEFEIVGLSDRVEVYFESDGNDNSLSLRPTIKCYIHPRNDVLKVPKLVGVAYDSTTIIWSWPEDEQYAHYLVEEAVDLSSEADQSKIIAQLPIGATSYTETGLNPNTPYTRRLINYTDEQTSSPSASVTVMTETVDASESLEEYNVPKNYDFTTDDSEREIIEEALEAFHSGIGDGNDLKVYKQMDADFYQKFKAYLELTGKRVQREKHYDQVGFNYKICLEAQETVEEQEGEVTFDLDAYPREDVSIQQYMFGTMPVNVYAKLYATIFLRKAVEAVEPIEVTTLLENWSPGSQPGTFYGNPLNVVFVLDKTNSLEQLPFGNGGPIMKAAVMNCIDTIEAAKGSTTVRYCIIQFAKTAKRLTGFTNAASAKVAVNGIAINGGATSWAAGLNAARDAITSLGADGKFVTYFFSDGFPNTDSNGLIHTNDSPNVTGARHGVVEGNLRNNLVSSANALKGVCEKVACLISDYGGGDYVDPSSGVGYKADYISFCHSTVPTSGGQLTWNDAAGMQRVFIDYIQQFSGSDSSNPIFGGMSPSTEVIYKPYYIDRVKAVQVETELIGPFAFDRDVTPIYYSQKEKRAIIDKDQIIAPHTQTMTPKSVYDLILDAAKLTPEWAAGYNKTIGTTDGRYLIKGLFIKDTYDYADEDIMDDNTFDYSNLEDGKVGSVNVYTDIDQVGTSAEFGDDCYLVSPSNYVYIDGYTDGIIYDGTRFVTTELNAYDHPSEILISTAEDYRGFLLNRKNPDYVYSGLQADITSVIKVLERGDDIWLEGYDGLVKAGDEIMVVGINSDFIAHNDTYFESPILNYRFNLEDPDAKTPFYEILPTCNPNSNYKHIIILHVYYARNVFITNTNNYVEQFGDDPIATTSSEHIPLTEYLYQWTLMYWKHDGQDNGRYIDEYLWFTAKPMLKTRDYYDELPGANMDVFYGLVNGRYRSDNQHGKQDLVVDTPQFNIPTTVHEDTIKIYILITEFYPESALVSYKWENPWNNKDSITNVNGDYVTFYSDSLTYKDMEYYDVVATINMENQEIFDNKTTEKIFEVAKPETSYEYDNYYLAVTTDNSDVLAMRYPTEIAFDENGLTSVGVAFKGVVNATSQWAPRIHNGYYYLNQHEYFAYSEFDVEADFEKLEQKYFKTLNGYITLDVHLRHAATPAESYSITKDTRSELLQDEDAFQWIDGQGVTLKPSIDGVYFREYLTSYYYSPVILFPNILTEAGAFNVTYSFEDGSNYLPMEIRSYITEEGKWSEWTPFENNTVPTVPLSNGYQVRINCQASVLNNDLTTEDYLCCYLDWKDEMDAVNTTNIVTVTDHMIAGPDEGNGIFISKILDFGCETELILDLFESYYSHHIQLYIAYASNADALLLENIKWNNITLAGDIPAHARYFRYKIVIPFGEKLYWLHKRIKTLETHEILPYISGVSMTGVYAPEDVVTNFINTEAFEIPRDGEYHTVFKRVIDVIGADVLSRGYTENEIEYVKVQCTTENTELLYDSGLDMQYPTRHLTTPIKVKSNTAYDIVTKNTPYIRVSPNNVDTEEINITRGTPQQYCPITVEDEYGHTYRQLYDVDQKMYVTDVYIMETKEKYIELKRNDFELESINVYINDNLVTPDCYRIVNHLLIFNDFLAAGDRVEMVYRIPYSFYADIDRVNNTTKLILYMDKDLCQLPDYDSYMEPYSGMSIEQMYMSGLRFSCHVSSDSMHYSPTEEESWAYDTSLGTFSTTINSTNFNGFISNEDPVEAYTHEVTIKSGNSDDDINGVIVAYAFDEYDSPHTLSYIVSRGGFNPDGYTYALVYDWYRPTQKVLCGFTSSIDPSFDGTTHGWSEFPNGIRIRIEKTNNILQCKASMWNRPGVWNNASVLDFDLNSDVDTQIFSGFVYYGYCNQSQANSYYTGIDFQAFIKREIVKKFKVYFETDTRNNKFIASDLSLNPVYRTDYKGFIYLTDEHNEPYSIKIHCNPLRLKAGGYDKVDVSIEVLDIQSNPVISKEVAVDCEYGILNCENYVTDMNGVVHLVYESAYLACIDKLTARVLKDDNTALEQSISIINE